MSLLARVTEEQHGEAVPVALIDGEIDASNVPEIESRLRAMLTNRSMALVVDLARTTYLDSAAINLFFELGAGLAQRQQRLLLVVPGSSPILRAVTITGLDAAIAVHPTRADALAAV